MTRMSGYLPKLELHLVIIHLPFASISGRLWPELARAPWRELTRAVLARSRLRCPEAELA
jgi:hypothetical protein